MAHALTLAGRGRGRTGSNPNVGCVIIADDRVVARGWTQPSGRPHAEAMALDAAGAAARGATLVTTLEPCAHVSPRGPCCTDLILAAGIARVVVAMADPDPRTDGTGMARLRAAGVAVEAGVMAAPAGQAMAGFLTRQRHGRPHVTLKLATSLDGRIALADGTSRWITGERARAHAHLTRAHSDTILVGGGTLRADAPALDVRLPGLADRAPRRAVLTRGTAPPGWTTIPTPHDIAALPGNWLLVEGGAGAAAAFLTARLVDRLILYRAPILLGGGRPAVGDIGLTDLGAAHGRWHLSDTRLLGSDRVEVYEAAGRE